MTSQMLLGFVIGALAEGLVALLIHIFLDANISNSTDAWHQEYKKIRKEYDDIIWRLSEDHRIYLSINEIRKIIHNETNLDYEVVQQGTNKYVYFLKIHWYIDKCDEISGGNYQDDVSITIDFRNLKRRQFIEIQKFLHEHYGSGIPTEQIKNQIKVKINERNTERD